MEDNDEDDGGGGGASMSVVELDGGGGGGEWVSVVEVEVEIERTCFSGCAVHSDSSGCSFSLQSCSRNIIFLYLFILLY